MVARLILDNQQHDWRKQDASYAHHDKRRAPIDPRGEIGADQRARGEPKRDAERENGKCPGAFVRREIVRDQRVGWCHAAGFADAHP